MANKDNCNVQNNKEQIELRSDNTRRFIGEEPPFIIRYGTIFIIILLFILAYIAYVASAEVN